MLLYNYQKRYLEDKSRWKAACWARQTGKTFTTTLEAVLDCLEAEAKGKVARWTILSINRERAIDAIKNGAILHLKAFKIAYEVLEVSFTAEELSYMIRFPGGSYIRAISSKPEHARGMSDNIILDEFAHHKDNRAIWQALLPVVSRPDLKLRVISTPNGVGDMFHEIITTRLGGLFSVHIVDIYQAVRDGLPRNIEELKKAMRDPDAWAQEFECKFIDRAGSEWLTYEEILKALDCPPLAEYKGNPCYVGMDIAIRGDLTVIAVLEDIGMDILALRELRVLRHKSFAEQLENLYEIFNTYRVVRACIDQTGMGEMPVEVAKRRLGERVQGVLFTQSNKLDMAVALKDALQSRKLLLPVPEEQKGELIEDLRAVKVEKGAGGVPRLVADRKDGHADRFWALALALLAKGRTAYKYEYESIRRREEIWI
ncbi:MAG: terminase family protein [Fervidobacterium sp.]|nr:terminase family protein [Fervidobacterium sp.]